MEVQNKLLTRSGHSGIDPLNDRGLPIFWFLTAPVSLATNAPVPGSTEVASIIAFRLRGHPSKPAV